MRQAEIITIKRRRRWSLPRKQEIVAETLCSRGRASAHCQRCGQHSGKLFAWRKAARDGRPAEESGVEFLHR